MWEKIRLFRRLSLGEWGEEYVASLYRRKGYTILSRNFFDHHGRRLGEIDIIAKKDKNLVFVEVKTRTSEAFGSPAEAVTPWKRQRLVRAVKQFLANTPDYSGFGYRIDVAELKTDLDRVRKCVTIIENAVEDTQ